MDAIFEHPRLVEIYDALDPDRSDLDVYVASAEEFGARSVLDIGCGTGTFALMLADRGLTVTGMDPADGSLRVAQGKPGAERISWHHGDASTLPLMQVDLATMTANVAMDITGDDDWSATLHGAYDALRPGGHLVFESRVPAYRAWETWTREATQSVTEILGVGAVETWVDVTDVSLPLVTFRWTHIFAADGAVITSDSTLRWRDREEVEADLRRHNFVVNEVRDAPDRPGREHVYVATRGTD